MIFIIGGKYNDKLNFALNKFGIEKSDVYNCTRNESYKGEKIIYNFHEIVRKLVKEGKNQEEILVFIKKLLNNKELIIISDEAGYGIVPIEKEDRTFREVLGRVSCYVAENSKEVYRVMYGIGNKIKG